MKGAVGMMEVNSKVPEGGVGSSGFKKPSLLVGGSGKTMVRMGHAQFQASEGSTEKAWSDDSVKPNKAEDVSLALIRSTPV